MELFWKKKSFVAYILSILVVLIHLSTFRNYTYENTVIQNLLLNIIPSVAVPLFFIISGALFFRNYSNNMYLDKLKNRCLSLFLPFVCWNIINMLFEIITSYSFLSNYFIGRDRFIFSFKNIFLSIFWYKSNKQFWFIFCLLVFILISPVIQALLKNRKTGFLSILTLIILLGFNMGLPEELFFSKTGLIYYLIGCYIGKFYFHEFMSLKKSYISFFFFLGSILLLILQNYHFIYSNIVINTLITIVYSFSTWYVLNFLRSFYKTKDRFKYSFFIYAMHVNISACITKVIFLLLPKNIYCAYFNGLMTVILTICLIELFAKCLKKYSIHTYIILSGNR